VKYVFSTFPPKLGPSQAVKKRREKRIRNGDNTFIKNLDIDIAVSIL
jgi:hypothetical protein